VSGEVIGAIGAGVLVYLGVATDDELQDVQYLVNKVRHLRIFTDDQGKMNLDVDQAGGSCLVISAFSTQGDARRGHRPAYTAAAPPAQAEGLYEQFCRLLAETGLTVATGRFQAKMEVSSINDGPICVLIDSKKQF
jgi:D-tyrosyl-tRNA(Tyr) deacylase